ncbi:uncharacterized protein [Physcomitrium patens]|uniref:Peroxiredoxin-like 2A n=1 Tax=Physcomitrium patens TaxID=3218 RepID=A0A2K1KJG9_PHYPA|nr:uncharacterized protein LOC112282170 [Physcomitrium patens]PNR53927.1 hypothetical protein PHYPA_007602 [Physcomitrium patens]|eukprot:XP_024375270.1 uncharacterized protein LOC112282170 [Physcomitrella patens]
MSSFALEDFVGDGVLRDQIESLMADGWDDVPTLKVMSKEDMNTLQLSQLQRDALELRTYLHDRLLMEYADTLEASGKNLQELLIAKPSELTKEYKMKRGHVARFLDKKSNSTIQLPTDLVLPARKITAARHGGAPISLPRTLTMSPPRQRRSEHSNTSTDSTDGGSTSPAVSDLQEYEAPVIMAPMSAQPPVITKGIFSAPEAETRLCGLVKLGGMKQEVTPLSTLEKILVQKLAPQHRKGVNPFRGKGPIQLSSPFKASELWADKPTLILCLRRPGCVMCRAEAHQLYSRKPIFDAMGVQLVLVLHEHIDAEVRAFWPRYWGGVVVVDEKRDFFKALGQGELPKEGIVTGLLLNGAARANLRRAKAAGLDGNYIGEGTIKGGMYIMRPGDRGVAYQFIERNFGDWAPLEEVLQVCSHIQHR